MVKINKKANWTKLKKAYWAKKTNNFYKNRLIVCKKKKGLF
jgi:hypothetical protein